MLKYKKGGFTLIELLIVIAIIGILATIVIVSLRNTADRTKDTRIVTGIVQIGKIADQMYLENANGFTDLCPGGTLDPGNQELQILGDDIEANGGVINCSSSQTSYCVAGRLYGSTSQWICADDEGHRKEVTQGGSGPCGDADNQCN